MILNLNHLEMFCQVARHHGIGQAARQLPNGIGTQQSSITKKMQQLETDLGVSLFERQPFRLTPDGRIIYERARELFDQLARTCEDVREGRHPPLRVAASEFVLREYFPDVIEDFNRRQPGIRMLLETGNQAGIETRLLEGTIDFAVTCLGQTPRHGIKHLRILTLPLVLVVPRSSRLGSAAELWQEDFTRHPLITLDPGHPVTRSFLAGLRAMNLSWTPQIVTPSTPLLYDCVAAGRGIGISLAQPRPVRHAHVRFIPLPGFDEVPVVALWHPPVNAVLAALRAVVEAQAALLVGSGGR